jgi:hypothetical protein
MKNFDPHLIRFGVLALLFVGRLIAASSRKRRAQNRELQPPQSAPLSSPMNSGQLPSQPMSSSSQPKPKAPDSPWSDLK